jgi:hypothetical protein
MPLPSPKRLRWQPLRGGLMNLYYFDDLRLRYEDGRLLLRGNNGTGKSRIMALQLPFLLDGEIAASRVEPDGDPSKRIEWHLLMDRYTDRVGYTWLEFARLDEDGTPHYKTIGCGMKAVEGKGAPTRWYFITDQRIDAELRLANKSKIPLKRQALLEVIGDRGRVFEKPSEYRVAVDQAFFELGPQRYGALLDLLIQLRRPQLSRKLDEKALSEALSRALPPLSERTLADIADAFRSLESDRNDLERDRGALESTESFKKVYRHYVQMATRRRADVLRKTHSDYVNTMRGLRQEEQKLESASKELQRLEQAQRDGESERTRAEAATRELEADPTLRDARRLSDAKDQAEQAEEDAERARERERFAGQALERAREASLRAAETVDEEQRAFARTRSQAESQAARVGLDDLLVEFDAKQVERRVIERERHLGHLQDLAGVQAAKRGEFERVKQHADHMRTEQDRATQTRVDKHAERDHQREQLEEDLAAWLDGLEVLELGDTQAVFEALVDWSEQGDGEGPIAQAVVTAHASAVAALSAQTTELDVERRALQAQIDSLEAERGELSSGVDRPPSPPWWRDNEARSVRDGAPLWALCDFQQHVGPDERALRGRARGLGDPRRLGDTGRACRRHGRRRRVLGRGHVSGAFARLDPHPCDR